MNVQHELARLGVQMRSLAHDVAQHGDTRSLSALRLMGLSEQLAEIAAALRPERKRVTGPRRWWFLLTRRPLA